ncbi:hypothetical protein GE061_004666 [Apolygus lucorum]|uniref:Uncharacterized protein n=1 Tax=Apolygus lucorum TaxID=248454 RepID=A0A8S9X1L9_APOLU|nr:hypothetical protein GE061_004666 [Apolygus lucorum]
MPSEKSPVLSSTPTKQRRPAPVGPVTPENVVNSVRLYYDDEFPTQKSRWRRSKRKTASFNRFARAIDFEETLLLFYL